MLGDQPVLQVVFEGQRMFLAVVDASQPTEAVVLVDDLAPVRQGLDQQAPGRIALVARDQHRAVIAELGLFQQMTVEVVGVGRTPPVEAGFLPDQSGRRVVQPILFAGLVFDFGEQQLRMVVAVLHPRAVGVDPARDQVQVVVILETGDAPELVALGGDLVVGAIAVGAGGARRRSCLDQSANGVPMLAGNGTVFIDSGSPAPQCIVGKTPHTAIGQGFFNQLTEGVPDKHMSTGVRVTDRQQLPASVVVVMADLTIRIDRLSDIALSIAPVGPYRVAPGTAAQETVAVLVGRWHIVRREQRDQPSDIVVAVFGDRA
ncbi:hypothetical protein PS876_05246 [Pseudomonas fluorescens]|nr:hypothetical protein PS876_05246 [Pseudomonas fluorescens]